MAARVCTTWIFRKRVRRYAHAGDDGSCFDCYENENLVDAPEHAELVEQLSAQLRAGWRGAAPGAMAATKFQN